MQFDTTINRWHTAGHHRSASTGRTRCSEYMLLDNSACNLASLNLLEFHGPDDIVRRRGRSSTAVVGRVHRPGDPGRQRADYPTEPIAETSRKFRQLGLGYANLGAMLMALGLPYDSDEGRAIGCAA